MIGKRSPQFLDQADQRGVRHESARPDLFVQVGLPHHPRRALKQHREKVECLRRQVDDTSTIVDNLTAAGIECPSAKADDHHAGCLA